MAIDEDVHRFTTEEYTRIVDAGTFADAHVELLDGLLIDVSPQGDPHARVIRRLLALFAPRADLLNVQMPMEIEDGWVPEPDLALAVEPPRGHPTTGFLVVEVAASHLPIALAKAAPYARAGVVRYWIVDIDRRHVLEHTQPTRHGYELTAVLRGNDVLDAGVTGAPTTTVASLLDGL